MEKIKLLKQALTIENIDGYLIPKNDEFFGEYLPDYNDRLKFISDFNKEKKVIACICSGAQLLISAKVVKNRNIAGYYSMKDDLINAGANYTDKPAVVDKNIVTTAHYKDMGPWMREVIKKIK